MKVPWNDLNQIFGVVPKILDKKGESVVIVLVLLLIPSVTLDTQTRAFQLSICTLECRQSLMFLLTLKFFASIH